MADILSNIERVRERIKQACARSGRDPSSVTLLAAVKDVPDGLVREAIRAGIRHFGENRVQEAEGRGGALRAENPDTVWHMIGHLQTNKVRKALELFDVIESVDSERLAGEISAKSQAPSPKRHVFVEVNLSGEEQKFGVAEDRAEALLGHISSLGNIEVTGLMTVPPYSDDPEDSRSFFRRLRELRDRLSRLGLPNVDMKHLSMGMSGDFSVAIEEGSDIIRVGSAIFGIEHKH